MALRLRRGLKSELDNLAVVAEGELIFTTDERKLYVGTGGNGTTVVDVTGAGGSSSTLEALTDTDLTGTENGDALTFNSSTNKWEPTAIPGVGSLRLTDLTDVSFPNETVQAGDILRFDGVFFTTVSETDLFQEQQNYKINIVGDDSTILVDTDTNIHSGQFQGDVLADDDTVIIDSLAKVLTANVIGNVQGNVTGNVIGNTQGIVTGAAGSSLLGTVTGELSGSVFGDDSSLLVDGIRNEIVGEVNNITTTSSTYAQGANVRIGDNLTGNTITLQTNEASSQLIITTQDTDGVVVIPRPLQIGSSSALVGDGKITVVTGVQNSAGIVLSGHFDDTGNTIATISRSRGTKAVPAAIQNGDGLGSYLLTGFNGTAYRVAGGIKATVAGAPQAAYIPSNVEIFVGNSSGTAEVVLQARQVQKVTEFFGPAKLVSYADTTARDAAVTAPEAGMMIYLTSTNKAQCYNGTIWNDLF